MKPRTRKAVAEAVAGMIPGSLARNRWRGILRYGLLRAWRLRQQIRRETAPPSVYLAVCAIAKNEGPYFEEWVEWHKARGVEKFYIYDNESDDNTREVLEPYIAEGLVEYNFWPGQRQQLPAYDNCLERHRLDARWIAFIDLDEFVLPADGKSIPEFLRPLERYPVVEVNWLVYGSGGAKEKKSGTVMERFTRHSRPDAEVNRHVKSFVDPRRVACMTGCHEAARLEGCSVDSAGCRNRKSWNKRAPEHIGAQINHYAVKSYDEFLQKRARGRARTLNQRGLEYFDRFDLNDMEERRMPPHGD